MKTPISKPGILFLMALPLILFSCKKDDDSSDTTKTVVQNNMQSGSWRISQFIDSGTDETNHFSGYSFRFNSSGSLSASNGSTSYSGSWSVSDSNSNDDSHEDLDFNIFFNLSNDFQDLNDDWEIISQSSTRIELVDVSGGNGGTDYLTFVKN